MMTLVVSNMFKHQAQRVIRFAAFSFCLLFLCPLLRAEMLELRGQTMGTTYMVKVFDPPDTDHFDSRVEIQTEIDVLLRKVNDQMSTYLKSSEISRFNQSDSTDWFSVSPELAMVVDAAQQIAKDSGGAFDVTVGPLVNAWSFGPGKRTKKVLTDDRIRELKKRVGYEKLFVKLDPPALKKIVPNLYVDLSSIAKGHGVDRIVDRLVDLGAKNVFVEIGGEVRTSGSKDGQPWKVGIEQPDAISRVQALAVAHPLDNAAMATSGDYRIFFEAEGKRYSHTIDPRSGRPIEHSLSSVSVVAPTCMVADGWATAINVLGEIHGFDLAQKKGLDSFMLIRDGDGFRRQGTMSLARYVDNTVFEEQNVPTTNDAPHVAASIGTETDGLFQRMLPTLVITLIGFSIVLSAMAVGVIFGRHSISGSCGGLANQENEDGSVSCSLCSNPSDACKELRGKMNEGTQ